MVTYTLLILGQALAKNIQTLLITRFLSGFFAVAPLTAAGGEEYLNHIIAGPNIFSRSHCRHLASCRSWSSNKFVHVQCIPRPSTRSTRSRIHHQERRSLAMGILDHDDIFGNLHRHHSHFFPRDLRASHSLEEGEGVAQG